MKSQPSFHSFYQDMIKQKSMASFVGWEQNKEKYALKVVRNKETFYFDIQGTPNDVTAQNYLDLLKSINNG